MDCGGRLKGPIWDAMARYLYCLPRRLVRSIDAVAVGVSLAFLDVNILVVSLSIGDATFVMSTDGPTDHRNAPARCASDRRRDGLLVRDCARRARPARPWQKPLKYDTWSRPIAHWGERPY